MKMIQRMLFYCATMLALLQPARAAVTFSITPSVVSNTYNGYLTFLVTGLSNATPQTVLVQKYLDVNADGIVDAGDILWQQFSLTDGVNVQFGGVTNINVPGDLDNLPGQITARLNFQLDPAQQFTANYLVVLSTASGSITNTFTVTNFTFAQNFTGTVADNGIPVPNAGVILFQSNGHDLNLVSGTVANNAGVYTLPAPAGTYALAASKGGFVANVEAAAYLTLSNGATFNTNLALLPATQTISGRVQDAGNSSLGLSGLLVPATSQNGLLGLTVTDTNGNFTTGVIPNSQWTVDINGQGIASKGYVGPNSKTQIDTTGGSVSGVTINLAKSTALVYGTVKDTSGNPLPGAVAVEAYDFENFYQSDGYTDLNGYFVIAALGGLGTNDLWTVNVDNSSSYPNDIFSQPLQITTQNGTNLITGTAVPAGILALVATNQISGKVLLASNGAPIAGVGVSAYLTTNGYAFNYYQDTTNNGGYAFAVGNGDWTINVNAVYGSDSLDSVLGGSFQAPPSAGILVTNNNVTANFSIYPCDGLQILTTNLPGAQVGVFYTDLLSGSTCSGMQNWSVNDPQDLPPNVGLSASGNLQGTPATNGTYAFTVQLNDNEGNFTNRTLTLVIASASAQLQVATTSLPGGTTGVYYSQSLQSIGGQPPVQWSLSPGSASLPQNLTLSTNGLISGLPATNGIFSFFVRATDSTSATADQGLSITINSNSALQITTTTLANATQNAFYSNHLAATGGVPPYKWSLSPGSANPPAGMSLATNGVLSGTPIGSGTAEFIVTVTDTASTTVYQVLSLTINPSSLPQTITLAVPAQTLAGEFQFNFKIAASVIYTVQSSPDLKNWTDYETFDFSSSNPAAGETLTVSTPYAGGASRVFYRVKTGL